MPVHRDCSGHLPALLAVRREEACPQRAGKYQSSVQPLPKGSRRPSKRPDCEEGRGFGAGGRRTHHRRCFPSVRLVGGGLSGVRPVRKGSQWPLPWGTLSPAPQSHSRPGHQPTEPGAHVGVESEAEHGVHRGRLGGRRPRGQRSGRAARLSLGCRAQRLGVPGRSDSLRAPGTLRALVWEITTSSYRCLCLGSCGLAPAPAAAWVDEPSTKPVAAGGPGTCSEGWQPPVFHLQ